MQVTITRLPTALSIVSIPRSRLDALSHPVLRALLQPNPSFLSITCNALELSLFAEPDSLRAFDAIARADQAATSSNCTRALEPVEISHDRWNVLQIDSHSDQLDNAGARVNELSAPLAAAGISILYQSSYMSDFIFVKERRLAEAMALFAAAGFTLYAADPNLLTALLEPPPTPSLTRERSGSAPLPSTSALSRSNSKSSRKGTSRASSTKSHEKSMSTPTPVGTSSKSKSKSPTSVLLRDVRTLAPDLACVGLADDAADHWALKIVKLVAFPDLIPLPVGVASSSSSAYPPRRITSPVEEENEGDDGYFSHSPSPSIDEPIPDTGPENEVSPVDENTKDPDAHVLPSRARSVPSRLDALPTWLDANESPERAQVSEEPQEAQDARPPVEYTIPFFSFTRTPEGSSLTTGARVLAALFPRSERHMVICGSELDAADREAEAAVHAHSPSASMPSSPIAESADEDADDDSSGYYSDEDEDEDLDVDADAHPLLTALQVDLRGAGLDTHGLVNRFSRALAKGGGPEAVAHDAPTGFCAIVNLGARPSTQNPAWPDPIAPPGAAVRLNKEIEPVDGNSRLATSFMIAYCIASI
ncbi:ACT-7 domain-containing protein [Mycena venus]|uniref:ACT-7 domain-containing protein n=1 Tax=Mycena venus TaxID=2733690 RepID=A0A8H6Y666_9AGAR|nr:ACT-7 domain-containing protein [Mycena venus]